MTKNLVSSLILAHLAQICQSLDIMVSYHHVQYQKKLVIQSWEILVMQRRTDGRTYESNFIGRCPTNVERPTLLHKLDIYTIGDTK